MVWFCLVNDLLLLSSQIRDILQFLGEWHVNCCVCDEKPTRSSEVSGGGHVYSLESFTVQRPRRETGPDIRPTDSGAARRQVWRNDRHDAVPDAGMGAAR